MVVGIPLSHTSSHHFYPQIKTEYLTEKILKFKQILKFNYLRLLKNRLFPALYDVQQVDI